MPRPTPTPLGPTVDFSNSSVELDGTTYSFERLEENGDELDTYSVSLGGRRLGSVRDTNGQPTIVVEADIPAETLRRLATAWFVAVGMAVCEADEDQP